jgi:hypothetical protein
MTCTMCGNGPVIMQSQGQTRSTVQPASHGPIQVPQPASSFRAADIPGYGDEPDSGQEAYPSPPPAADKALVASLPGPSIPSVIRNAPIRAHIPRRALVRFIPLRWYAHRSLWSRRVPGCPWVSQVRHPHARNDPQRGTTRTSPAASSACSARVTDVLLTWYSRASSATVGSGSPLAHSPASIRPRSAVSTRSLGRSGVRGT